MRKLVSELWITVDGIATAPDQWTFEHVDEDLFVVLQRSLDNADGALLGRVTYQEWADYWPTSTDEPFASWINSTPKYVATTQQLDDPTWANTTILEGDLAESVTKIKQQSGKNINVAGSPSLVRSLVEQDLLDVLTLCVFPVIAGKGVRLFTDDGALKRLQLTGCERTKSGVAFLTYERRA